MQEFQQLDQEYIKMFYVHFNFYPMQTEVSTVFGQVKICVGFNLRSTFTL